MAFQIPDLVKFEIHYQMERLCDRYHGLRAREWINSTPWIVGGMTVISIVILTVVMIGVLRSPSHTPFREGKRAWFYDLNSKKLFLARSKNVGPIDAPSGPLPTGEPAGVRAHVYSYVLQPKESELFVGFLERPDPNAGADRPSPDTRDLRQWARGRWIRRVSDDKWFPVTNPEADKILQVLTQPNERGQTPIYHVPR